MKYDLYLSYSGRKTYLICSLRYKFAYIDKVPVKRDPTSSLYGSVIGLVFDWFYSNDVWKSDDPVAELRSFIPMAMNHIIEKEKEKQEDLEIDPYNLSKIEESVYNDIPSGLESIRKHKLLSLNSHSELDLTVIYKHPDHGLTVKIGGRSDFTHYFSHEDVWILDGKGSNWREIYSDPEQLIWYATQHYLKYHVAPTRLGFLYWKFPEDPVQWIDYDESAIRSSLNITFDVAKNIKLKVFRPRVSKECRMCAYINLCEEGKEFAEQMRIETKTVGETIFDLDEL